jgi:AcrR family transcriptional regulator
MAVTRTRPSRRRPTRPARAATRPTPGRRARQKATTQRRILTAALDLFQTKGFQATTTRAIARRAGIAEGTVFNYFATKEDIALYFFEQEVDHAIAAVRSNARLKDAPLDEQLFALIQSQLEFLAPYERFIGAAIVAALQPGSRLGPFSVKAQESWVRYLAFVQDLLDGAIRKREISPIAWWTPQAYWLYYLGIVLYWLHDRSPGKQDTMALLDRSLKFGVAMLRMEAP